MAEAGKPTSINVHDPWNPLATDLSFAPGDIP